MGPIRAPFAPRTSVPVSFVTSDGAIAFSLHQTDSAPGLQLAASLCVFWKVRGHATEGADALRALLDAPAAQRAPLLRARALATAAYLLEQTGGYPAAGEYCDEALAIARSAGMTI